MPLAYTLRVTSETPTRLWVNNPSLDEIDKAIAVGAINCTTNPSYCSKLLKCNREQLHELIRREVRETDDDDLAADRVYSAASARIMARFRPLYEASGGTQGFVTMQGDPREDEDADCIVRAALRYRALGPNCMAKIPVTEAGLVAIEELIVRDVPITATEVFSLDQTIAVCELYQRAAKKTGKRPPFYVTHITGIYDQYLAEYVQRETIDVAPSTLAQAGCAVGRREYHLMRQRGFEGVFLGGGARGMQHFTEFVGGELHITLNWSTIQDLNEADGPLVSRIDKETLPGVINELVAKLVDFRRAYFEGSLSTAEFAGFGPVQLFRTMFLDGYQHLLKEVAARRQ